MIIEIIPVSSTTTTDRTTYPTSQYNSFNKYKAISNETLSVDGTIVLQFDNSFIELLDTAITNNNLYLLSPIQKTFIEQYFNAADTELSSDQQQFDAFLAAYKEPTNE